MKRNAAQQALTNAVNRAIANGSPVYTNIPAPSVKVGDYCYDKRESVSRPDWYVTGLTASGGVEIEQLTAHGNGLYKTVSLAEFAAWFEVK